MKELPILKFNNMDFYFAIELSNGVQTNKISAGGWKDLSILDNIFQPFMEGSITLTNDYETLERSSDASLADGMTKEQLITEGEYKFRGDGRDKITIRILPVPPTNTEGEFEQTFVDLIAKEELWNIAIQAYIYDYDDESVSGREYKNKILKFREIPSSILQEKNVEFSSHEVLLDEGYTLDAISNLSNSGKSVKTGKILKKLLRNQEEFALNMDDADDPEKWDDGGEESTEIYSSPTNFRLYDDLLYILYRHHADIEASTGIVREPCILTYERGATLESPKQFNLKPLKSFFDKNLVPQGHAGEYYLETFLLKDQNEGSFQIKNPEIKQDGVIFVAESMSEIRDYEFSDMAVKDYDEKFNDSMILTFNNAENAFYLSKNKVSDTVEYIKKEYLDAKKVTAKESSGVRFVKSDTLENNFKTSTIYSTKRSNNAAKISMIVNMLLLNTSISIKNFGATIRQAGKFFGVQKLTKNDRDYDNKFEGQYFATTVIHYFDNDQNQYYNDIVGVKFYEYDSMVDLQNKKLNVK